MTGLADPPRDAEAAEYTAVRVDEAAAAKTRGAKPDAEPADKESLLTALKGVESTLRALQGESPLIFPTATVSRARFNRS